MLLLGTSSELNDTMTRNQLENLLADIESVDLSTNRILIALRTVIDKLRAADKLFEHTLKPLNQSLKRLKQFGDENIKTLDIDHVPCIQLDCWPSVANGWLTKNRLWPDRHHIEEISQRGVHAVNKPFCHDDIDWRLSFSAAETYIADLWSADQHFVYFVFKCLFYKFIKGLDKRVDERDETAAELPEEDEKKYVTSYLVKTVMLNVSESYSQSWWCMSNAGECLTALLLTLRSAFQSRRLEHHFIPSLNLLHGIPGTLADCVADSIGRIMANLESTIPLLEEHFPSFKTSINAIEDQMSFIEFFRQVDIKDLLNRIRQPAGPTGKDASSKSSNTDSC